ncbi:MAG: DNA mismatch repair endonuclease MutL [Candidatus Nitronauta litoralis]|uniref:DNA mismatch repair protein MutL n=1 Tax=Candidatus Nitronauta litoralis TaxID=2705533 RepID=A0A7T0BXR6_9BACT|nr:MAG: DNA mismatch repair endonuclease MutL [Candidatus Nitronauta litoralis]
MIQVLPETLANQIAAGEVVDRPASVVKELVENAIDAGARKIRIEIEGAGKNTIRISDNGKGMSPADAALAFERHATSKVATPDDLFGIETLGFRGEALPSIASVSRIRLTTATEDGGGAGTEVVIEGGSASVVREIAHSQGTAVEVSDLFYNTPARKKFLKADSAETRSITQVVTQQALAWPEVAFQLINGGRKVIDTLSTDQTLYRIAELFGADMTRELISVDQTEGSLQVKGFVSSPVFTKSNRNAQYCYINSRFVKDKIILSATQLGYSHLLPRGQHPAIFLFLTMDPKEVDVNVHPAKAEVRFAHQQEVHLFIMRAVKNALRDNFKPEEMSPPSDTNVSGQPGQTFYQGYEKTAVPNVEDTSRPHSPQLNPSQSMAGSGAECPSSLFATESWQQIIGSPSNNEREQKWSGSPNPVNLFDSSPRPVSDLIYAEFEPLGQLNNSFIIMQGPKGILVVDQHIAHERVLYERFREAASRKSVEVQTLMFPLAVEFSPAEATVVTEHLTWLKEMGLEMEALGSQGFILRSVPAILKNQDHEEVLRNIAKTLGGGQGSDPLQDKYDEVQIMMACRQAIKINHPLNLPQIQKLIYDLEQTEMPFTCPHGRPIALLFEMDSILRKFHRK